MPSVNCSAIGRCLLVEKIWQTDHGLSIHLSRKKEREKRKEDKVNHG
jgi:hypothetical protein